MILCARRSMVRNLFLNWSSIPLTLLESAPMVFDSSLALRGWLLAALLSAVVTGLGTGAAYAAEPEKFWVFVGTYTDGKSKGIYRMVLDTATGKLSEPALAAELDNPSFLAVHPTHKYLYAVNESSGVALARSRRLPSTPSPAN